MNRSARDNDRGERGQPGPASGCVVGGRKYSRAEVLKLFGTGLAGTAVFSGVLARKALAATTPSNPGGLYVLNWEDIAQRSVPGSPPPGWAREYDPTVVHADGKPQLKAYRQATLVPVRDGSYSARFALVKGDPVINNGTRCELSSGFEPRGAERWYGFSIYLPSSWAYDQAAEIVTQWHQHWSIGSSPPLAIMTHKGQWVISQNWEGPYYKDTPVGAYQRSRWTDWVVHVKWSAGSDGRLSIWKDGQRVPGFYNKQGKNTYSSTYGNYMKIGIYKWAWSQGKPSDVTERHMYYDALKIADGSGSYAAVAPR
jgi:Polysaccharide lyase